VIKEILIYDGSVESVHQFCYETASSSYSRCYNVKEPSYLMPTICSFITGAVVGFVFLYIMLTEEKNEKLLKNDNPRKDN